MCLFSWKHTVEEEKRQNKEEKVWSVKSGDCPAVTSQFRVQASWFHVVPPPRFAADKNIPFIKKHQWHRNQW